MKKFILEIDDAERDCDMLHRCDVPHSLVPSRGNQTRWRDIQTGAIVVSRGDRISFSVNCEQHATVLCLIFGDRLIQQNDK
jgi:protein-arginine kinase